MRTSLKLHNKKILKVFINFASVFEGKKVNHQQLVKLENLQFFVEEICIQQKTKIKLLNQNVLFPLLDQLGWEAAFQATFGINTQQFNQEFLEFLELPIEQQLEIIPDI